MAAYAIRRLGLSAIVVVGVSIAVFMMLRLVPGDPVSVMLSQGSTAQDAAALKHELGLDRSVFAQYERYAGNALTGDLGTSIRLHEPVARLIGQRLPATLELTVASLALATALGVLFGTLSAVRHGRLTDHLVRVGSLAGVSLPSFWLGLMLILLFGVELGVLPIAGRDGLASLVLPAVTLAMVPLGIITRMVRSSVLDALREDYIRTARAKGLGAARTLFGHALRNSLIPLVTVVGVQFGTLLGGAIIVETVFAWPGVGSLLIDAVSARDFPLVQGIILMIALGFVLVNLAVDLLYAVLDPRIRDSMETAS
ncbi:MAG TPA: ABC transporter permease [Solirubrobacter sp.]|nr:ABC transporter permease [Solirubrobacter sp.]